MTHYEVLGVSEHATSTQIRNAYRKLVKQYHPDKNPSYEASEFIKQINEAYDILSDPRRRATYDRRYQVYFEPIIVQEETPQEIYRREFIKNRREKDRIKKRNEAIREAEKDKIRKVIFVIVRWLSVPMAALAIIAIVDAKLPPETYEEVALYGWQRNVGGKYRDAYASYMQTNSFTFEVPNHIHINYDYNGTPSPLQISITPIFKQLIEVSIHEGEDQFSWSVENSVLSFLEYLLLISSVVVFIMRKYSRLAYSLCFIPVLVGTFIMLVLL